MKRAMKASLMLMAALTLLYVIVIVYANANTDSDDYVDPYHYVVYAAYKSESDAPPSVWYTPEELGIVEIYDFGEDDPGAVQITVDRQKEPFPLQEETPIFLFRDDFYIVSSHWVTFADSNGIQWQVPTGVALGTVWTFLGVLFVRRRMRE